MILDPANDEQCLGQLTAWARELVNTQLARHLAARLGSRRAVLRWLQSLPQLDDDGDDSEPQAIACDVPQRVRLFPPAPNCVERTLAATVLLEVIDPATPRAMVTIDEPARHTALGELRGDRWQPVDLFPRRQASADAWADAGKWIVKEVHPIGKAVLSAFGYGAAGEAIEKGWQAAGVLDKPKDKDSTSDGKSPDAKPAADAKPATTPSAASAGAAATTPPPRPPVNPPAPGVRVFPPTVTRPPPAAAAPPSPSPPAQPPVLPSAPQLDQAQAQPDHFTEPQGGTNAPNEIAYWPPRSAAEEAAGDADDAAPATKRYLW